jgi:hypothetical protein
MNSKEIFSIALGLQSPWQIQGVESLAQQLCPVYPINKALPSIIH